MVPPDHSWDTVAPIGTRAGMSKTSSVRQVVPPDLLRVRSHVWKPCGIRRANARGGRMRQRAGRGPRGKEEENDMIENSGNDHRLDR